MLVTKPHAQLFFVQMQRCYNTRQWIAFDFQMEGKMIAESQTIDTLLVQITGLSPEFRLRLIQRITDTLLLSFPRQTKPIQFGKHRSGKLSTLEDFSIAEWRPTDKELDGE